ncbi:MAG: universal stress protein [Kofleriaceae bacterium]|nr:universal stress protein [Kofleriaceae bacterium]MBP9171920.1 universal stress protein [Kofleriaceae bacterium]MBP9859294.1 universal stress protein [Kofleriaceae bacterium]
MTRTIAHTTDRSGDDRAAFVHATALAATSGARMVTVHGNAPPGVADELPDAAALAARWGRAVVHERRCHECCDDVADTLLDALAKVGAQLVVAGTHARTGLAGLLKGSVGLTLARNLTSPTLIVPNRGKSFVDERTGAIDLRTVLIPAGDAASAARGLAAAELVLGMAGTTDAVRTILHVGEPPLELAAQPGVLVRNVGGAIEAAILEAARHEPPCLIVMPSRGHDSIGDALFGSHTDHIVKAAGCPVLVVPQPATA